MYWRLLINSPTPTALKFVSVTPSSRFPCVPKLLGIHQLRLMADGKPHQNDTVQVQFSPPVNKIQEFVNSDPYGGWEKCWEEEMTPWDLGQPTPILQHLLRTDSLPKGRALVPGCGSGYDVVALASPERYVIGLDLSEVAIKKARALALSSPKANNFCFLVAEFFTWEPSHLFDLIFDYTSAWASRMRDLLKPDGELITLMFPIDDHAGGPPYKTSVADYEEVLHPVGFKATSIVDNELAVGARKGREKLGRWRKIIGTSRL